MLQTKHIDYHVPPPQAHFLGLPVSIPPAEPQLTLVPHSQELPDLPYDVLSTIFQLYVNDDIAQHLDRPIPPRKHEGPLLISQVCQYWRGVAFSTPTLWSALAVDYHLPYNLINHFLTLAKRAPLCLSISLWTYDGDRPNKRVLDLLLSRAHRWRSVRIWFDEDTAKGLLQRPPYPANGLENNAESREPWILEEATIEGGVSVSPETSRKLWSFFLNPNRCPNLTRLRWSLDLDFLCTFGCWGAGDDGPQNVNYERLTHLTLSSPPPMAECLRLLQRCTSLQSFHIDFRNTSGSSLANYTREYVSGPLGAPITPPSSLRNLVIRVDKPAVGRMMSKFTTSFMDSGASVVHFRV